MGRKRKPKRQGAAMRAAAKWEELALHHFDFILPWRPPVGEFEERRSAWRTWREYLADWAEVREYVSTLYGDNWGLPSGLVPYAEEILRIHGPEGPPVETDAERTRKVIEATEQEAARMERTRETFRRTRSCHEPETRG